MSEATNTGLRLFVYALCEPDGKTIRYVGLSANLRSRFSHHLSGHSVPRVAEWVRGLRSRGVMPAMIVLHEVVGMENGLAKESEEIKHQFSLLGDLLLNEASTGKPPSGKRKKRYGQITVGDKSLTLRQWARELGITRQALDIRLRTQPIEVALRYKKNQKKREKRLRIAPPPSHEIVHVEFEGDIQRASPSTRLDHASRRERRRQMAQAVSGGEPIAAVALSFCVTASTVRNAVNEFCGTQPKSAASENPSLNGRQQRLARWLAMAEAVEGGASLADVADLFGVNPCTVKNAVREKVRRDRRARKQLQNVG